MNMDVVRVVLADDNAGLRGSIRSFLEKQPEVAVVGEASNGVEALECINMHSPHVLLLDLEMPVLNGIGVLEKLNKARSSTRVLVLSAYTDTYFVRGVLEHGAAGYLTKDELPQTILKAILRVASGEERIFSERVESKMSKMS